MDSGAVWTLVSVLLAVTTGEACMPEGLLNQEELEAVQQGDMGPAESDRQWIFPSLQFTCTVNLTGWLFSIDSSDDVVCPTVQLWNNFTATSTTTDFLRVASLTPDDFTDPTSLSQFVYRCTLNTPIVVNAGTVVGFLTRSPGGTEPNSSVMLQSGDLVGYSRNILSAATIFNIATAQTIMLTPLITPVFESVQPSQTTPTTEPPTKQPVTTSGLQTSDLPSPEPTTSFSLITTSVTPLPSDSATTNARSSSKSNNVSLAVVAIIVTAVSILVIAGVVFLVVLLLFIRRRRQTLRPTDCKTQTVEKALEDPGSCKIMRVRSRNSYTSTPIYEDVSGMDLKAPHEEHDYDFIRSASVREAEKYEIPQSSPSSSQNGSAPQTPAGDQIYEAPLDTLGPFEGNALVVEDGYNAPVHTQTQFGGKSTITGESGYDTPVDGQTLPSGRSKKGESGYEDSLILTNRKTDMEDSTGPPQIDNSGVYEDVDFAS